MDLCIKYDLPFLDIFVKHNAKEVKVSNVLLDTGSAKSILSVDILGTIGISPESNDTLRKVRGIGGIEIVFMKCIETLSVEDFILNDFSIQVGAMNYGFDINGILGMDFLKISKAVIDIDNNELTFRDCRV